MDFLRAASIVIVVLGHWFIGMIYWNRGVIGTTSAIGLTPWMWLATWFLHVMPIFFFVGGFSNLVTYRSYERKKLPISQFLKTRALRLVKPSLVLVAVWIPIQVVMHILDIGRPTGWLLRGVKPPGATVPFGPLWFLGVYLLVVLAAPFTIALHRRFGLAVPALMIAGAFAADIVGFAGGRPGVRWFNAALVWLIPHQLGYFYADGKIQNLGRTRLAAMALAGLGMLIALTNPIFGEYGRQWFPGIGHYPKSLMGTDVEPISNAFPPTLCLLAMGFWSIGLVLLARPTLTRWLERPGPWKATIFINGIIMTLFLWHMTAFLVAVLMLWPLGFGRQTDTVASWWWERPLWLGVPAAILAGIVLLLGRFERPATASPKTGGST
ncbi:MAG: acyltransferase family protein [Actinomycetota bacterium]